MPRPTTLGVIPARWSSRRFPGKPLATLAGQPLIEHVWRQAGAATLLDRIVVATDDERIRQAATGFGAEVVLTRAEHPSGSDRVAEVARQSNATVVVNIQGDEPLLPATAIDAAIAPLLADDRLEATTLAAPVSSTEDLHRADVVKVVVGLDGRALYFSRQPIPHVRDAGGARPADSLHHIGLFAYRRAFLLEYAGWSPTPLELAEGLEQLRILEHGRHLHVVQVDPVPAGVDTPDDLDRVARWLAAAS